MHEGIGMRRVRHEPSVGLVSHRVTSSGSLERPSQSWWGHTDFEKP
jgi:hypothetical protein